MKNRKKKNFTIIELIVVIAIIAVLMALLMPVVNKMSKRAKETKAKAEMQSITIAIKSYESTYGLLPVPASWANGDTGTPYSNLMNLLTNVPAGSNSRSIRFLDVPEDYTANGYVDPWGNKFHVYMDTDYDGQVTGLAQTDGYGTVFIYSTGSDGTDGTDNDVHSWE